MALIFALFNSSNHGKFPQLMLFDEPDAHLHPSLTDVFLDVIQRVLIKKHRVKVIISTHSPSTVALAPDSSIYVMDKTLGYPVKQDKSTALKILSNGLASMSIEESSLGINYNISKTPLPVLFTEGITDKITIELAWKKLYNIPPPFYVQDCFDASFLSNLFMRGDDDPDGIFIQFPDRVMMALFDFDNAGYNGWNRGKKEKFKTFTDEDPRKCLTRSNDENAYIMLLPVPENATIRNQVIIKNNQTYKDGSVLTIEHLMFGTPELDRCFNDKPTAGGSIKILIKDKKDFTELLKNIEPEYFIAFIPLFDKIKYLISSVKAHDLNT